MKSKNTCPSSNLDYSLKKGYIFIINLDYHFNLYDMSQLCYKLSLNQWISLRLL